MSERKITPEIALVGGRIVAARSKVEKFLISVAGDARRLGKPTVEEELLRTADHFGEQLHDRLRSLVEK